MKKTTKVTKAPATLKDLIDGTDWKALQVRGVASKLPDDSVSVHFTHGSVKAKREEGNDKSDWVRVRLGKEVLEKLDWKTGDNIHVANHPDDHLTFLMFKVDSRNGFRLGVESGCSSARLHFSWRDTYVPVKVQDAQLVQYEIHKKQLIFRFVASE